MQVREYHNKPEEFLRVTRHFLYSNGKNQNQNQNHNITNSFITLQNKKHSTKLTHLLHPKKEGASKRGVLERFLRIMTIKVFLSVREIYVIH